MRALLRPVNPGRGHPAQQQGPLHQRMLGKGNCSQNSIFFSPQICFFFSFPKVLKFWEKTVFLAAKGGRKFVRVAKARFAGTIRQGRNASRWQDRRGRDAPVQRQGGRSVQPLCPPWRGHRGNVAAAHAPLACRLEQLWLLRATEEVLA